MLLSDWLTLPFPKSFRKLTDETKTLLPVVAEIVYFNNEKGFGFARAENYERDLYLHISTLQRAKLSLPKKKLRLVPTKLLPGSLVQTGTRILLAPQSNGRRVVAWAFLQPIQLFRLQLSLMAEKMPPGRWLLTTLLKQYAGSHADNEQKCFVDDYRLIDTITERTVNPIWALQQMLARKTEVGSQLKSETVILQEDAQDATPEQTWQSLENAAVTTLVLLYTAMRLTEDEEGKGRLLETLRDLPSLQPRVLRELQIIDEGFLDVRAG